MPLAPSGPVASPLPLAVRLDRLNIARAAATLGVVFYHVLSGGVGGSVEVVFAQASEGIARIFAVGIATFAAVGHRLVDFFFVLSGFVIHRLYCRWRERHPTASARQFATFFLWQRFWRLVPPFWIALFVSYVLAYDNPFSAEALRKLVVNASLLKTLWPGYFFSVNHAHWYIAVQWQLDLLYPCFLYILHRRTSRIAFAVVLLITLAVRFGVPHFSSAAYFVNLPFRWWGEWILGVFLADQHYRGRKLFPRPWLSAAVVVALVGSAELIQSGLLRWASHLLSFALIIEVVGCSRLPGTRIERWIAPLGVWSYSLYLLHIPVLGLWSQLLESLNLRPNGPVGWMISTAGALIVTVCVSRLAYRWIEVPSVGLGT
ncbi:MAG TPA: acyltransferase, partial [Candidatus Synoicihabitans sp.]|nr:acyltransferase [Candidatus Synoicihabitans sp.]